MLKSGHKTTKEIPYNKRILQPIVRETIKYLDNYLGFDLFFVEVYERAGDLGNEDYDKTYEVFKEMLKDGVIVGDASPENFGVLLKPNLPYHEPTGYKDDEFYIDDETVGIYNAGCSKEILDAGEVVVRDIDCLYYFRNVHKFIENNVKNIEDFREIALKTREPSLKFGPKFDRYLDRYCKEVEAEFEKKNNSGLKK